METHDSLISPLGNTSVLTPLATATLTDKVDDAEPVTEDDDAVGTKLAAVIELTAEEVSDERPPPLAPAPA